MAVRLLIIEDSSTARRVLRLRLPKDVEFDVVEAEDGEAAIAAYADKRFDIVLLDLTMPGMNGFEVLPRILALDAQAHVIILTADTQTEAKRRCINAGAKGVLNKPVNAEQLDAVIRAGLPPH